MDSDSDIEQKIKARVEEMRDLVLKNDKFKSLAESIFVGVREIKKRTRKAKHQLTGYAPEKTSLYTGEIPVEGVLTTEVLDAAFDGIARREMESGKKMNEDELWSALRKRLNKVSFTTIVIPYRSRS